MDIYSLLLRPALFRLSAETAHHFALFWLSVLPPSALRSLAPRDLPTLPVRAFGLDFPNPVGLAAGMDKNADCPSAWEALGFGFAELGTITRHAQPGNQKPRAFRYPAQSALINRMGFNNIGADAAAKKMEKFRERGRWPRSPVGINLGKSKITPLEEAAKDYRHSASTLRSFASYFAINVSSPNTPGLRLLQSVESLKPIIEAVLEEAGPIPVLVKVSPDLADPDLEAIARLAREAGLSGLIATNTTLDRSGCPSGKNQEGGLSGSPLNERSTHVIRVLSSCSQLPIIASGGVMDRASARNKVEAGATLIQVYTGFVYRGPEIIRESLGGWLDARR